MKKPPGLAREREHRLNKNGLLLESLRLEGGTLSNVEGHNRRLNASRKELFGSTDSWDLREIVRIPPEFSNGLYKCRVLYSRNIEKVEFIPYVKKTILRLRIVYSDTIDYHLKFSDRSGLEMLRNLAGPEEDIIIVKNGLVTDASSSNLVFDTGNGLLTPASPLLRGTRRELLLSQGDIRPGDIGPGDIGTFRSIHLINAMLDLGEAVLNVNGTSVYE